MGEEWSKAEKRIARRAFELAYRRECQAIAERVQRMATAIHEPQDLWRIHDLLTKRRRETDKKYDYRYSVLPEVFARLLREGWLTEADLQGLDETKIARIRQIATFAASTGGRTT